VAEESGEHTGLKKAKASIYIARSMDGYIAGNNDGISWLDKFNDGTDYGYDKFIKKVSAQVMGRVTYEKVKHNPGDPAFSGIKTYVVTSRKNLKSVAPNVIIWTKGIDMLFKELGRIKSGLIWPVGGAKIMAEFINRGFVKEYIIFTMPVLLGEGKRMFEGVALSGLRLTKSIVYKNGVIEARYSRHR